VNQLARRLDISAHKIFEFGIAADPEGNISFMRSFGHNDYQQNNLAHPLLVHAELVRTGNSRLKETAQLIYNRYLEPIAQSHDRS
jgi:hypothetical protein